MYKKKCIAMILAGGQGTRLAALTTQIPKPAIPFGGSWRLVDFSLSNCYNSGINTVGILTSKRPFELKDPMNSLITHELFHDRFRIHSLPPSSANEYDSYTGTANAIYENINFVERFAPEYVIILSGDHVYKMDYNFLIGYHKEKGADATISVIEVPWPEAPRFGIMSTRPDGSVVDFTEKPTQPKSNLASMGVYIFSWPKLKYYLMMDESNPFSSHDFGKNIIPSMLKQGEKIYAYSFNGYWKDVGTVESLYKAHMDLLSNPASLGICDTKWPIYSTLTDLHFPKTVINNRKSLISENCVIRGEVVRSVIAPGTYIGNKAKVRNSVIMPGAYIGHGAYVEKAIIGPGAAVENGSVVLGGVKQPIAVISENRVASFKKNVFEQYIPGQKWGRDLIFPDTATVD